MRKHPLFVLRLTFLSLLCLGGCALPAPEKIAQDFIPDKELLAASLVNDALASYQRTRYVDAELKLQQALYLFPDTEKMLFNLAVVLEAEERFDEALAIGERLYAIDPHSFQYLSLLGQLHSKLGRGKEARRYFREGLATSISKGDFVSAGNFSRNIAVLAFAEGREEEALCASGDALGWKGDADEVYRHARLQLAMHNSAGAERTLSAFLEGGAGHRVDSVLHAMAMVRFAQGRYGEASDLEKEARLRGIPDGEIQFESMMVDYLAQTHVTAGGGAQGSRAEDLSPEAILTDIRASGPLTLYWPLPLLQAVEEAKRSIPVSEGEGGIALLERLGEAVRSLGK